MSVVPPELVGLWRRELITAPGMRDDTTQVVWLQTSSWYADLRVPAERPLTSSRDLAELDREDLGRLARVQGFAGELAASADRCLWRRDYDFQPPGPLPDEGSYDLQGAVMIERGVHAEYEEIWRKAPQSEGAAAAFGLASDSAAPGRRGLLVAAGDHFMCVLDRLGPPPTGRCLSDSVADPQFDRRVLDMPICYGRISTGWRVELSSLPWLEGEPLWGEGQARYEPDERRLIWRHSEGERVFRRLEASPSEAGDLANWLKAPQL